MTSNRQTLVKLIQDSIDKGATTVEEIHKSIGDLPLKILEGSKLLKGPAKEVRQVRDHTIGAMYDLIRKINEEVGTLASERLAEAAKRRAARRAARSTRHAARRELTLVRRKNHSAKSQKVGGAKQASAAKRASA
jgi:alpha-D-ribose 1-methylphosphonate 5-triphosphate synthase subunit PhnL